MSKPKCFLILPRSVFPTVSGYAMKNKQLIEILNRHYQLKMIVLSDHAATIEETEFYRQHSAESRLFYFPKWRYYLNALFALLGKRPIQTGYYTFRQVKHEAKRMAADCHIAIGVLVRTMEYLETVPEQAIKVFDMMDSIGLNYKRSRDKVESKFWKLIYSIETNRLLRYEQLWVKKADIIYLFNNDERKYWQPYGNVKLVPHGVKPFLFEPRERDAHYANAVAFIGKMDYQPNIDAVKWYIRNVHPLVGDRIPLIIIGAFPTEEVQKLAEQHENITVTGFVDDPYRILGSTMAVIAPMQTGGGIQNKVLEGMAVGQINVISSLAARPILEAVSGEHFLIADTPQQYAEILTRIREHPERYAAMGSTAREFIRTHYTWETFEKTYIEGICQIEKSR